MTPSKQLGFEDWTPPPEDHGPPSLPHFDGEDVESIKDRLSLGSCVRGAWQALVKERREGSLWEIQQWVKGSTGTEYGEQTISAKLRDLRKPRFGEYNIQRRKRVDEDGKRTWVYFYEVCARCGSGRYHKDRDVCPKPSLRVIDGGQKTTPVATASPPIGPHPDPPSPRGVGYRNPMR